MNNGSLRPIYESTVGGTEIVYPTDPRRQVGNGPGALSSGVESPVPHSSDMANREPRHEPNFSVRSLLSGAAP